MLEGTASKSSLWTRHGHSWQIQDINGQMGKSCLKRNLFQETPIRIAIYAISSRRTNRQRKAPHANRTSEDTAFQDVNLEIRMFSCQNVLDTAPRERAKVGENRKGRDVRS